jgi:hypothetical protein
LSAISTLGKMNLMSVCRFVMHFASAPDAMFNSTHL